MLDTLSRSKHSICSVQGPAGRAEGVLAHEHHMFYDDPVTCRFLIEKVRLRGGSGIPLSLNINQAIILRSNNLPTLDRNKDT